MNMACLWFLGFGFPAEVPHSLRFGKNCKRCFQDSSIVLHKKHRPYEDNLPENINDSVTYETQWK